MNYNETLEYLFTRLPMFQRSGPAAYKNNLDNTLKLDELYDHPHRQFKTIHVAGTNGKGSVSHMLAAILLKAGYKTGLYTSPHLKDFRERIRVDGKMMPEKDMVEWVEKYRTNNVLWKIEPSFFELTVAMAFDYFASQKVDFAVIEVGVGGRLDSTNIVTPEVSVITNIGLDHTNLLGNTLELIAAEKAGIIKKGVPVVVGTTQSEITSVFQAKAGKENAPLYFADQEYSVSYAMQGMDEKKYLRVDRLGELCFKDIEMDLTGSYQHKNLPAVLKSVDLLKEKGFAISEKNIREALAKVCSLTGLQGRWQVIGHNPLVVCDTGHNEDGIKAIAEQINNTPHKRLHFVFGTVGDKDPDKVLALLPKNAQYYFVKAGIERALDQTTLKEQAARFDLQGDSYSSVSEGFAKACQNAGVHDLVFVGGSTFVVAEIL